MYCIVGLQTSLLMLIRPCFLSDFRFFLTLNNDIFIKDFCEIVQAGVVEFCMQDYNDVLYRVIANQPSHAFFPVFVRFSFFPYFE